MGEKICTTCGADLEGKLIVKDAGREFCSQSCLESFKTDNPDTMMQTGSSTLGPTEVKCDNESEKLIVVKMTDEELVQHLNYLKRSEERLRNRQLVTRSELAKRRQAADSELVDGIRNMTPKKETKSVGKGKIESAIESFASIMNCTREEALEILKKRGKI